MKFILLCFLYISLNHPIWAQSIEIGEKHQIFSSHLQADRNYFISLPEHYQDSLYPNETYPVIYVLDAQWYFEAATGIFHQLSWGYYPQIPECIVVGIENNDRIQDFTADGQTEAFTQFLEKELMPLIDSTYRTQGFNTLIGHSFGGLFAINTLIYHSKLFEATLAIDPSVWKNDSTFFNQLPLTLSSTNFNKQLLFLANANSLEQLKNPSPQHLKHVQGKSDFIRDLKESTPNQLWHQIKDYPNENHGSVYLPSIIDGIRAIFSGFRMNAKEAVKHPELIESHYQNFSQHIHQNWVPPAYYLKMLSDLAVRFKQAEQAKIIHQMNIKHHPNNSYLKTLQY